MLQTAKGKILSLLLSLLAVPPVVLLVIIAPSQAFTLDFSSNPTLTNGSDLQVGAEYTYSGVATDNGITIDAVLTIDGLQNSASLTNIDVNDGPGFTENIQPQLDGPDQATQVMDLVVTCLDLTLYL